MKFGYVHKGDQAKLKFHTYLAAKPALPPPPKEVINSLALSQDIGMQGNDEIGLCTFADIAHGIVITTAMNKGIFVPQTADTIKLYEHTGYDPSQTDAQGNNPTDQGASLTEPPTSPRSTVSRGTSSTAISTSIPRTSWG